MFMTGPQPTRGFVWTQASWGPVLRCEPLLAIAPHLFTTRHLELRNDEREWEAVAAEIGVERASMRLIRQVHGVAVAFARAGHEGAWTMPEADVVSSDDPSVAVGVRVADCAPILIADRRRPAVAAVHAGWRGTMQRAVVHAVSALATQFGSHPLDLVAAIGPCLGPCCGEVGPEVVDAFRNAGHEAAAIDRWFAPGAGGRPYLNLWRANEDQLESAGVHPDRIFTAGLCTRSYPGHFHSYRAFGPNAGRMLGVIRARE